MVPAGVVYQGARLSGSRREGLFELQCFEVLQASPRSSIFPTREPQMRQDFSAPTLSYATTTVGGCCHGVSVSVGLIVS